MIIRLHRLRNRGWPIPKYQFSFKDSIQGELTVHEERDAVLNRYTRVARLRDPVTKALVAGVPPLLDAPLVGLTREVMSLPGIERHEDIAILKIEDFAQTWLCWLDCTVDGPG